MNDLQLAVLIFIVLVVAAALIIAGYTIGRIGRRLVRIDKRLDKLEKDHGTLVDELRQAFDAIEESRASRHVWTGERE